MPTILSSFRFRLFSAVLLITFNAPHVSALETLKSTQKQRNATVEILNTLDARHFVDMDVDDQLSARFLKAYIEKLDPSKSFFLQSDINEFNKKRFLLDDEIKKGVNNTGFTIYQRFKERISQRLTKVISSLKNNTIDTDYSIDEEIVTDAEVANWPQSDKEANELWRKRIKSFFLAQKLAEEDYEKTRKDLVKRYEGQLDRIEKNKAEDVYEIYINSFTELYDPHTNYLSPRSSESFSIRMSLSLEGIGAVLQTEDEYTKVVRIVTAGPAAKQGQLKPADRIIGVAQGNGEMVNVVGWRLDDVVDLIRGPKDSIVRLNTLSSNAADTTPRIIRIKRDKVKLEDQAAQKAIIELKDENGKLFKIGVIDIPAFYLDFEAFVKRNPNYRSTTKDVNRLLYELQREGVDGVIVDLRDNGGGSLYEATSVTDLFIDKGPVVQIGKDDKKQSNFSQNNARYQGPLVVLINRLSASASEIFAGAIQDYQRGIIVGSQSFGKGTVQTLTPLKSQGELKITESKFYRVSGGSTQHRGVIPDILMPELINTKEVGESSYDTALAWSKTAPVIYNRYFSLNRLLEPLTTKHEGRITSNPDFVYMNEQKDLLNSLNANKTVSLNEKKRLKEKQRIENISLGIENKRRKAKGLTAFESYEALKDNNEKENDKRAAAAGTTVIDTSDDAILKEAGYILKDYVDLLTTPNNRVAAGQK